MSKGDELGIQVGDKVQFYIPFSDANDPTNPGWDDRIYDYVGTEFEVKDVSDTGNLYSGVWWLPPQCCRLVEDESEGVDVVADEEESEVKATDIKVNKAAELGIKVGDKVKVFGSSIRDGVYEVYEVENAELLDGLSIAVVKGAEAHWIMDNQWEPILEGNLNGAIPQPTRVEERGLRTSKTSSRIVEAAFEALDGRLERREFESGAMRNSDDGKLGYEGFTNPLVMKKYAEFMSKHRKMEDGTLRSPDNWQSGIPVQALIESATRHFEDVKLHHRGYGNEAVESYLDSLFGVVFNVLGLAHAEINLDQKSEFRS